MLQAVQPSIPFLALDHDVVLSAWEEIGGDIFTCDDIETPSAITLDLSGIEESLRQSCSASFEHISSVSVVPNLFPALPDLQLPGFGLGNGMVNNMPHSDKQTTWNLAQSQPFIHSSQQPLQHEIKLEMTTGDPQGTGSTSSMSSCSADVAIVPEVSSHPAFSGLPTSPGGKVPQQFMPCLIPPVPTSAINAARPNEPEAWRTRRECLERYKEKKARRMYTKKIRYQLRKINADKRPRIKGRFVKKEELDEYMKVEAPTVCSDVDEDDDLLSDKE